MSGRVTTNFRGYSAVVLAHDEESVRALARILEKLGLDVTVRDPRDSAAVILAGKDIVFLDADDDVDHRELVADDRGAARIALIGSEAPSRLSRVVRYKCVSHILKPIRGTGVFTAVLLAVNEHARRRRDARALDGLRDRLAGRREVTKAVLHLMRLCDIDEDAAYDLLRLKAMNKRISIDRMAREYLRGDEDGRLSRKA